MYIHVHIHTQKILSNITGSHVSIYFESYELKKPKLVAQSVMHIESYMHNLYAKAGQGICHNNV